MSDLSPVGLRRQIGQMMRILRRFEMLTERRIAVLESVQQSIGIASVPLLTPGQPQITLQVTIRPGFPDTNYSAAAALSGAQGPLGQLSVLSWTNVSGRRVDVEIRNTGVGAVQGATCTVVAVRGDSGATRVSSPAKTGG